MAKYKENKKALMEKIMEYCERPMSDSVAEHLSVYYGAMCAICMAMEYEDGDYERESREWKSKGDDEDERIQEEVSRFFMRMRGKK